MNYFAKILKGYLLAFFIFFLFTVFITLLIKFTAVPESQAALYLLAGLSLSTIFLGLYMGNLIGKHGLMVALAFSLLYTFLVLFAVLCAYSKPINPQSFDVKYAVPVLLGGIGGIIGVNLRK
ncbi:TIGR04086 family membrane protein [Clostridium aminobutyricum]|uniref:TIGR04086 family membrane protein n=1 Tax=Clostridium aminobutyricum TaxID=33953 RepID=A0A939IG19_CLOAM|nr:TIGR04086 family membrane protein [Clostridium aminobutyricum]MBN7772435.1 TIGR04086 family membrane protein [Clostridium aminobutyricum]